MDAHARVNAIFYAGSRVYLSQKYEIGDPGALTPDPGALIPITRSARRELLKEKRLQMESQQSRRSNLTARQEKRQKKRFAKKLAINLNADSKAEMGGVRGADNTTKSSAPLMKPKRSMKALMAPAPKKQNEAISRTMGSANNRELTLMEDPENWEQRFQAGCSFWYNLKNHRIRKEMPLFKGRDYPDTTPERYSFGTGCILYNSSAFLEGKNWTQQLNHSSKARPYSPKLLAQPNPKLPPLNATAVRGEGTGEEVPPTLNQTAIPKLASDEEAQPAALAAVSTAMAPVDAASVAVAEGEAAEDQEEEYSDDEYHDEFEEDA